VKDWENNAPFRWFCHLRAYLRDDVTASFRGKTFINGWNLKDFLHFLRLTATLQHRFEFTHGRGGKKYWKEGGTTDGST